ncbi:coiled-coil domain-containing protein 92 isoform X2 [Hemicordylus capensis]|uniref:coiled-coil domain-containing protein 92 isoform X2 n=1 Tax=Hemicordylus capensis TaxID=884348 RepID=UPI0023030F16|nr:coiled-coil domain-containing protein 92 isoform X2 [Hemicordylus capensis]
MIQVPEGARYRQREVEQVAGPLDVRMAASNLENQLHSAQKNLLFLQREHANTLKGLHAEIRRLQQHCTDLTYELTLKSSDLTESGNSRSEELKRKCEELEAQLKVKEAENNELLKELEQKNAMIMVLENTIKEREKKYLEELKMKSHKLNMLSSELEQRASTIAYLTSQLHATKKKLMSSSGTSDSSPSGSPVLSSYKPAPPKDKLPETPRRRMKKSLSTPLNPEFDEAYRLGADSRKLLLREPLDAMPDPTPFLLARETAEVHLIKERPLVIPPIPSERSSAEPPSPARGEKQHKAHVGVAHRIHHVTPPQAQPQVETLAVDQVNGSKVARKHSGTDRTV